MTIKQMLLSEFHEPLNMKQNKKRGEKNVRVGEVEKTFVVLQCLKGSS